MEFVFKFLCDTKKKAEFVARETILQDTIREMLEHLKKHPKAQIFLNKVAKKEAPGYYDLIKNPMDLTTMTRKIPLYRNLDEFAFDIDLIVKNCLAYNTAEYYVSSAYEFKEEVDLLLMKFQRVYPIFPEEYNIYCNPIPHANIMNVSRKTIARYLKTAGFDSCTKQCLDILFDVFIYVVKKCALRKIKKKLA